MKSLVCCALLLVASPWTLRAHSDECCDHCQCQASCCKVCRCVPTTKKVTKPVYSCKCEDFCVPGPSTRHKVCDECGHHKTVYTPTCADVRTRKVLVKQNKTEEVPTYKWVVETLCPRCAGQCAADDAAGDQNQAAAVPAKASAQVFGQGVQPVDFQSVLPQVSPIATPPTAPTNEGFKSQMRRALPVVFGRQ